MLDECIFKINDIVYIISDTNKCLFYIIKIYNDKDTTYCRLKGVNYRITCDEIITNISHATDADIQRENKNTQRYFIGITSKKDRIVKQKYVLGKILHIDGDIKYLEKCMDLYDEVGVYAYGIALEESKFKDRIIDLMSLVNPDIIVVTGHDFYNNKGVKDINNYKNTVNFINTIQTIKKIKGNSCVIIAGACQSNYESLIASGADFASSPKRINIHTYDPAVIAIKVATTSFIKLVDYNDIEKYIENGKDAFSGLQTFGKMRLML